MSEDYTVLDEDNDAVVFSGDGITINEEETENYSDDYVKSSIDMTNKGFDPMSTQSGLTNSDNEGGIVGNKSTHEGFSDKNDGGLYEGKSKKFESGTVDLSGFSVMPEGYSTDRIRVNATFSSIEAAKMCVNGDKFMYVKNGEMVVSTIEEGTPEISNDEQTLLSYVDGEWRRL